MSGGVLDARAYALLANAHRPTDRDGQRIAARELARQGLKVRDIAAALAITELAARQLLTEAACPE